MTIPENIRQQVMARAQRRCEYCQVHTDFVYAEMEVDHIEPLASGGSDDVLNLCHACPRCNGFKWNKTQAVDPITGEAVPLYNPRKQSWSEHFTWAEDQATIIGKTACGRATVEALRMNRPDRVKFRQLLVSLGSYPPKL